MKGETSGNRLRVVTAATDCDKDTLLFRVEVEGDGLVCHEGTVSCFTSRLRGGGSRRRARNGNKLKPGNSQGQPAGCDDRSISAGGLEHLRQRPLVFSLDRRSGD